MRAIRIDEWGGPEVMRLVDMPETDARRRRGADRGLARGRELRRHASAREQLHRALRAAAGAGRRGGGDRSERAARGAARRRDDGHRRLRGVRDGARGHHLPAARRGRRRAGARAADPGPDGVAPVPHVRADPPGRDRGGALGGGRRRLAGGAARQADGRGSRDRDGFERGEAVRSLWSSARTWRSTPRRSYPSPGRHRRSRRPAARCSIARSPRSRRSGGSSSTGCRAREKTRVSNANLLKTSRGIIGFWLMHAIGRPGMLREPLADLFERAARGEVRRGSATRTRCRRSRAHTRTCCRGERAAS